MKETGFVLSVVAIVNLGPRILLARKMPDPSKVKELAGKWVFPGGRVLFGESLEDAVKRILWHEIGLRVDVGEIIGKSEQPPRRRGGKTEYVTSLWLQGTPLEHRQEACPTHRWDEARWVHRSRILAEDVLSDRARRWMPLEVQMYLMDLMERP